MPPKISVIIPVYNGGSMAAEGIRSVLEQTYPAHEVIVVDDGSTDDTPQALATFGERIKMKRIPNSGPSGARNEGMRLATGDWIAFLDHDDLWFTNRLEKTVQAIEKYPEVGFFCCNYVVRYAHLDGKRVGHYSILRNARELNFDAPLKKDAFGLLLKEHFVGTPSAVLIRRDIIRKAGDFNPKNRMAQDYEYWLQCALHTNIFAMSEALFYKRLRENNVSGDIVGVHEAHLETIAVMARLGAEYIRTHGLGDVVQWATSDNLFYLGNVYFEAGRRNEAFASYRRALATYPTAANTARYAWTVAKKRARHAIGVGASQKTALIRERVRALGATDRLSFSVLIATMNRPVDLKAALDSVAKQSYPPRQVVVIDQSTDTLSKAVTEEFRKAVDSRIRDVRYVYQDEKSLVKARNRGILYADADIVSFLDDDVVLREDYYERIERCFAGDPSVGGVSGNASVDNPSKGWRWTVRKFLLRLFLINYSDGHMTASGFGYPIFEREIDRTIRVEMLPGCNMNFRIELLAERRFDEWFSGYSYREDADFSYSLSRLCPMMMIADARLQHNYSKSNRLTPLEHKIMEIKNCRHVFHKYKPKNLWTDTLFAYSLTGLALIDLLEFIGGFKKEKWKKFTTGVAASWSVLWQ